MTGTGMAKGSTFVVGGTTLALLILVALPLSFVLLQAIFPELAAGSWSNPFAHIPSTLSDPALLELTFNTLRLGACVVLVSALVGIPLGALRGLYRVPFAQFWDLMFLIPFLIPPYIAALGWIMTLQPNGYAQQLLGIHLASFLFSFSGVVFVMTLNVFPVVYFAVSRSIASTGSRLADVGRVCGAKPWTCFWRITLPLALPAIAASLLLVFAMSIEEYGTPAALAANAGFFVLVTGIERRFSDWPIDLPGASTLSIILVMLAMLAFWFQRRLLSRQVFETTTGKPNDTSLRHLGVSKVPVTLLFLVVSLISTAVPIASIAVTASSKTLSGGLTLENMSFVHFESIFSSGETAFRALTTSALLGVGTAIVTGVLGVLIAYCVVKTKVKGRVILDALAIMPNTLPGIVVAVGLILAWNQSFWPVTPYNSLWILLLAYCCLLLPYPVRYAHAALSQIGDNMEAAARVHGASVRKMLIRILFPLMLPSMVAAMLLVFAVASRELVASILLAPTGIQTTSLFIWRQFEQGSIGQGMAMSVVTILMTTTVMVGVNFWQAKKTSSSC